MVDMKFGDARAGDKGIGFGEVLELAADAMTPNPAHWSERA